MVQILPARQKAPSFSSQLGAGIGQGIEEGTKNFAKSHQQQQMIAHKNKALRDAGFGDYVDLPEKAQAVAIAERLKGQRKEEEWNRLMSMMNKNSPQSDIGRQLQGQQDELQQQDDFDPSNISDEDIIASSFINPAVGRAMGHAKDVNLREQSHKEDREQTKFQKDREYNTQFSKPVVEAANNTLQSMAARRGLVNQWRRDIQSGEASGLGQYLVDRTGLEFWRTPEAARSKTAAKEYFIEGLGSLSPGTRPNMFIEQQLSSALPTIGRDVESGLSVLEMQNFLDDLKEQYARNVQAISNQDIEKYGYVKQDISSRAQKMLDEYAPQRQEQLAQDIRKIHEDQMDDKQLTEEIVLGRVRPDTPMTQRTMRFFMIKNNDDVDAAIRDAQKSGFALPKKKK